MNKLTLRPLLEFIKKQKRTYLTSGDWQQLEAGIKKRRAEKLSAGHGTEAEDEYLKLLIPLHELFTRQARVKTTVIINALNQALVSGKYGYNMHRHEPRHQRNTFYPKPEKTVPHQVYDLAFYHAAAGRRHMAHHYHDYDRSVYYMRCEERADTILFGNMQIDARRPRVLG